MKLKFLLSILLTTTSSIVFAQTPTLVKDINSNGNGNPQRLINIGSRIFFVANNGTNGNELWVSDGTESGSMMVKDINVGSSNASIVKITPYNNKAFFKANSSTNGYELWMSDGTESGTQILKEFSAGTGSIDPSDLIVYNGSLYFTERSNSGGVNLWKSDGTEAGTVLIKNLYSSGNASNASYFTIMNNTLYFIASENALFSSDIWKSDGTENGTGILITMGGQTGALYSAGNKLFFAFSGEGGAGTGKGLYVSDGMVNGTYRIKELNLLNMANFPTNGTALVFKNNLIFTANDGVRGEELWISDGTETGTVLLKDLNVGSSDGLDVLPYLTYADDTKFYFVAKDDNFNKELWVSDGSTNGTMLLDTPNAGSINPLGMYAYNGYLYYRARHSVNASGEELWRTDGTTEGTKLLVDFWSGINSSSPNNFCGMNNKLYFSANNGTVGTELYGLQVDPVSSGFGNILLDEIKIFPNPANNKIMCSRDNVLVCSYKIYSIQGKLVSEGILEEDGIDISELEKGLYVLKVDGAVGKFIKN